MFGRIQSIDNKVLESIGKLHKPTLNRIMITASRAGNFGIIWWIICLIFISYPRWRTTGFNMVLGLSIAHISGEMILKHIVKRVRPCHKLDDDEQLINRPRFYSFPSGHTTASFSVVGVAILRCGLISFLPILVIAMLIGFSRLYLRVHYLTDVVVGMLLGFVCGISSVLLFNAFIPVIFPNLI